MSEPLAERLSRFTPDAGKLDRDALLFAAGRASARPGRPWMALAGALAASQLLTLLFLWPRTPAATPSGPPTPPIVVLPTAPVPPPDPSSWSSLRERIFAAGEGLPAPPADDSLLPDEPPWRAFGSPPPMLLN
jgi:hypothetical protein